MNYFSIRKKILRRLFHFLPNVHSRSWCLKKMGVCVGKNVGIPSDLYISDRSTDKNLLIIEDRVEIAAGCKIITTTGPKFSLLKTVYPIIAEKVIIKNDVWIGTNVVILQGVTIGEYSIIGAGCIVNQDIPPFSFTSGNPIEIKPIPKSFINRIKQKI